MLNKFTGGIGPEEEDGLGWDGLVPTREEREEQKLRDELAKLRLFKQKTHKFLDELGIDRCEGVEGCRAGARGKLLLEMIEEIRFAPLGDNHHNAAKCPYCNPKMSEANP